jgi:hypothetical protein
MNSGRELKENLRKLIEKYKVDPYEISMLYEHKAEVWIENTNAYENYKN